MQFFRPIYLSISPNTTLYLNFLFEVTGQFLSQYSCRILANILNWVSFKANECTRSLLSWCLAKICSAGYEIFFLKDRVYGNS